jgi:hypothetical protein
VAAGTHWRNLYSRGKKRDGEKGGYEGMARGMCMCNASIVMHDLVEKREGVCVSTLKGVMGDSVPSVTATGDPAEVGEVE